MATKIARKRQRGVAGNFRGLFRRCYLVRASSSLFWGGGGTVRDGASQRDLLWRAEVAIWQAGAYHSRSSPATCQLQHFCCRHLQLCPQPPLRAQQSPWSVQKNRQAVQRMEGKKSSLWLKSEATAVGHGFP